jgi:V8-like Glu-specific endopeptidase
VRFRVNFLATLVAIFFVAGTAGADDIGAAARGVVRIIVIAESYSNPDDSSVVFGSGFAISPHRIVTNAHVVEAAQNPFADSVVAIVPAEGSKGMKGTVVAFDAARDLAVVDVGAARLEPLAIYSGPVDSGQHTAALGYPGNVDLATARSIYDLVTPTSPVRSEGNVSSERSIDGKSALLHTAAISRGNSGGPLVDECGRVLGVNTYTTQSGSGDAPFGFAIVSQELMSFLRDEGEDFRQIGSGCVTAAQQAQREREAGENAAKAQAVAEQRALTAQQQRVDAAKADIEDSRENHTVGAALLGLLSLFAGLLAAMFLSKDRAQPGVAASIFALVSLASAAVAFFTRPSLDVRLPPLTPAAAAGAATGNLLCHVNPDLSRITVSSTEDLAMNWTSSGCMNGRTQYLQDGAVWRRVLVPNGTETVLVQEFDPTRGEYISARYLLPQTEMNRLRAIRGPEDAKRCTSDAPSVAHLQRLTQSLTATLPETPNEKIVYKCSVSPGNKADWGEQ